MAEDASTMDGEPDAGRSSAAKEAAAPIHQQLARFYAARETLTERLARTRALVTDAKRIVGPGSADARNPGNERDVRSRATGVPAHGAVLGLAEVAERTGRHPDLLRRWCEAGRIPAIRVGRSWAIPESRLATIDWPAARRRRTP